MHISLDSPLILFSIPLAWLTVLYPSARRTAAMKKSGVGFDNVSPRDSIARCEGRKVSPEFVKKLKRMEGANANGNEALPIWMAAVFAGLYTGLDNRTLNLFAATFLSLRVLYNFLYLNQTTQAHSYMRTTTWSIGIAMPFAVIIKSGLKLLSQS